MPLRPCRHPTCTEYAAGGYCPAHISEMPAEHREKHRRYDQRNRDKDSKRFYNSAAWLRARSIKLENSPFCQLCTTPTPAVDVHHLKAVKIASSAERIDQKNLMSLCKECHTKLEKRNKPQYV